MLDALERMMPTLKQPAIAASALIVLACGDASGPTVATLVVTPQSPLLAVPQTLQFTADPRDGSNAPIAGVAVSWSADDPSIATVSAAGLVAGVNTGTTTIRAHAGGVEGHSAVSVVVKALSVTVSPPHDTIATYRTKQFAAVGSGYNGLPVSANLATWQVNPDSLASVDANGLVTALAQGDVAITATIDGVSSSVPMHILQPPVDSIAIVGTATTAPLRGHAQFIALLYDERGHQLFRPITWTSSNSTSMPFDSAGWVRGAAAGSATVTASSGAKTSRAVPLTVLILPALARLSVGDAVACGVGVNGAGYCWGANTQGELGDGTTDDRFGPVAIAGALAWDQISAGAVHACGITTTGQAYCWGVNSAGQLGDGTTTERHVPTPVAGGLVFRSISAGHDYSCGVTTANAAYCWGGNGSGQLGTGGAAASLVPVAVQGGLAFQMISTSRVTASPATVTCGVTTGGAGYCWGTNTDGQLGTGDSASSNVPRLVAGSHNWAAISASTFHGCGVADSGVGYCWGANPYGAFGNGSLASDPRPTAVAGGGYAAVSAGYLFGCGVQSNGNLVCFGTNDEAQLGAMFPTQQPAPVAPAPALVFATAGAGRYGACALTTAGIAHCWGRDVTGIETIQRVTTPQKVLGQP